MSNIINYFGNAGLKHNKNKTEVLNHNLRNTPVQVSVDPDRQLFQDSVREARMLGIHIDGLLSDVKSRLRIFKAIISLGFPAHYAFLKSLT